MASRAPWRFVFLVLAFPVHSAAYSIKSFEMSYKYGDEDEPRKIIGREPDGATGDLPVYIWFAGTGDHLGAPVDVVRLEAMAARGFIAAAVEYPNTLDELVCTLIFGNFQAFMELVAEKAAKVFPVALNTVCAHARANCQTGVAVSGHSQGGFLTLMSLQHGGGRVTAVQPLGVGCDGALDTTSIMDQHLSKYLAKEKRLALVGGNDDLYVDKCLQQISGYPSASTSYGPGYMVVPDGSHGYYNQNDWSIQTSTMKCVYRNGAEYWALSSTLDWLAKTAVPTKFVQVTSTTGLYTSTCNNQTLADSPEGESMPFPSCLVHLIVGITLGLLCCLCCLFGSICYCWRKKKCCCKE